jgi:predicted MFS family arabinose efflux permease
MRIALLGAALAGFVSAVAPNLLVLAISRTVAAGCVAALIPATLVYVGDMWPSQVRQRPLAEVLTASSLGTALATAGAGLAADLVGWRAVPAVTGAAAAALWVALRRLPEPDREPVSRNPMQSLAAVVRHRWAQVVLVLVLVEGAIVLGVVTYLAPTVQASFGVGAVVLSRVVRVLVGRMSAVGLAAVGAAMLIAGWALPAFTVSLLTVTVGGLLVGGSWAFLHTTLQSWATEVVPGERAAMVALFAALLFLGGSVGTALLAPLADTAAFDTVFRVAATASVPLAIAAVIARRRYGDRGTVGPAPAPD